MMREVGFRVVLRFEFDASCPDLRLFSAVIYLPFFFRTSGLGAYMLLALLFLV